MEFHDDELDKCVSDMQIEANMRMESVDDEDDVGRLMD